MIFHVWGFPLCLVMALLVATALGATLALVLAPLLVWTCVLYVRCTIDAIKHRHHGKH